MQYYTNVRIITYSCMCKGLLVVHDLSVYTVFAGSN